MKFRLLYPFFSFFFLVISKYIKILYLSFTKLTLFPVDIWHLTQLTKLYLLSDCLLHKCVHNGSNILFNESYNINTHELLVADILKNLIYNNLIYNI